MKMMMMMMEMKTTVRSAPDGSDKYKHCHIETAIIASNWVKLERYLVEV